MRGDAPKDGALDGQVLARHTDGFHELPRIRSSSPLTSFLVGLGLLDEVNLLEREVRAWGAVERIADGQLRAARALERLRHAREILDEDNKQRGHDFDLAAEQRAHAREMAKIQRKIDALRKGAELTNARREVFEASRRFENVRHPPPPEKPPEPETLATFTRQFREALAELESAPLEEAEKAMIRKRMTAAFQVKLGDMTV